MAHHDKSHVEQQKRSPHFALLPPRCLSGRERALRVQLILLLAALSHRMGIWWELPE